MQMLSGIGLDVPKVYGFTYADGKPAMEMERIYGYSMDKEMKRHIFSVKKYAKKAGRTA